MSLADVATGNLRAVIYTRISLDRDGEGEANERQEDACRALCAMRGWTVVEVVEDISISAYKDVERPGWAAVLEMMKNGECDIVVAWKMDRVTRTVAGLLDIIKVTRQTGVAFATTDGMLDLTTPTGKAVATILATVAELEVELKVERQLAANKQRREKGEPWTSGWLTFGYDREGNIVERQAELIRQGAKDFLAGKPLTQIARDWDASGQKPRSGGAWHGTSVRDILKNPRVAGYVTYYKEATGHIGQWEPILDEETHALIVARLADPERRQGGSKHGPKPQNLLTQIATCGVCGELVHGSGKDGRGNPAYRCSKSHTCTPRARADALVVGAFSMAAQAMLPGLLLSIPKEGVDPVVLAELKEQHEKLDELADSFAAGTISMTFAQRAEAGIQQKIQELEGRLKAEGATDYDPRKLNAEVIKGFAELDLDGQRAVLSRLARVRIFPMGRGKKNVPMRHQVEMDVKVTKSDGTVTWVPVLDERPKES